MDLGIDIGTSGVKAVLVDGDGRLVGAHTSPLAVSRPHGGWSEQDPADWISATDDALAALATAHRSEMGGVRSIGLSGQMHGATLLDAADEVLRPAILWNDVRSHAEAAALDADAVVRDRSGNAVFPGFTAPKLAWVQANEPELFDRVATVLLPKDHVRLWLTGEKATDASDASGTSWLDVGSRSWSTELLERTNLTVDHMPTVVEGSASTGTVRSQLAERFGFDTAPVVAGGGGDNAASAVGLGVVAPGAGFVSLGTSGVVFAATDAYSPQPETAVHTFCHALPDTWHQMSVMLSAADAMTWYAGIAGQTPAELTSVFDGPLGDPSGVTFLPYLSGERTPHNDADVRGAFVGLAHTHDTAALTHAVMEGVCHGLRDGLDAMTATGTTVDHLVAVGGGSNSPYWLQMLATVLDTPIVLPADADVGAAIGAARLGRLAATGESVTDVATPVEASATIDPDPDRRGAYADAGAIFRSLYPAITGATS